MTIAQAVISISRLQFFSILNNGCNDEAANAIAEAILSNRGLETVYGSENNLQSGAAKIMTAFTSIKVKELNLGDCHISEDVADDIATVISYQEYLETLALGNNNLGSSGIIKIANSLCTITTVKLLNFYGNQITERAAKSIALAILSNSQLEQLYLGGNKLCTGTLKIRSCSEEDIFTESIGL